MTLPHVTLKATCALADGASIVASFADGSSFDLTTSSPHMLALGAHVAMRDLGSVPVVEALVDPDAEPLDAVLALDLDRTHGQIDLIGDDETSVFILHHADGDEVLAPVAALTLISVGVSAMLTEQLDDDARAAGVRMERSAPW